ncbi:hypothetical protein I9W82_003702 [Candida metapsilosis]|uniref:Uncharacterized protein n=1 Tax=Candida metapsilosis TaxID=273372 RepID=A0A8H7ZH59_9ASCO|nr:hypothetical protein I9W82_003702 [Candida metapsilosis]
MSSLPRLLSATHLKSAYWIDSMPSSMGMERSTVKLRYFKTLRRSKRYPDLHRLYVLNQKSVFKTYTKVIGLIAGVIAIKLNYMQLVPDWGFNKKVEAEMTTTGYNVVYDEDVDEIPPARLLSKQFYNDLNMYLFKLVVLSKWRILKTYHPLFSKVQLPLWNKLETLLMCFGFLKMMNLNDYINEHKTPETERISRDSMIKMARFVS